MKTLSLRALLIQKSIKLSLLTPGKFHGLRALLIQKSIKPLSAMNKATKTFESFVNSEEYQTYLYCLFKRNKFESFVNSEEYQTIL